MGKRKYDSAAYIDPKIKNVEVINVEDLIEEMRRDKTAFMTKYTRNLYCPECNTPQLSFCSAHKDPYLRGFKNQTHNDDCSFGLDEISNNDLKTKINNEPNERDVLLRLNQVIDSLLKKVITKDHPLAVNINSNGIDLKPLPREHVSRKCTQKRIPSKSLTAPFLEEDYNKFMVFYGRVKIKWKKRCSKATNKPFMALNIYKRGTENPICSGIVYDQVYNSKKNNVDCDNALIAMFTSMTRNKEKNCIYTNFRIEKPYMIIIEKE